mmetsp:Transcript_8630/g.24220  ORF Transcript_8630/g.24220 Transcript_8630/m.24220 type:complete len:319 (-) Transcript_8630:1038-1994(-)
MSFLPTKINQKTLFLDRPTGKLLFESGGVRQVQSKPHRQLYQQKWSPHPSNKSSTNQHHFCVHAQIHHRALPTQPRHRHRQNVKIKISHKLPIEREKGSSKPPISLSIYLAKRLAAAGALVDLLTLERYGLVGAAGGGTGLGLHPGLDLAGHGKEGLLDVGRGLGGGFEELDAEGVGELLALLGRDDPLGRQVGLVADEELVDILAGVAVDLVEPLLDVVEGFVVGDVVDDDDAVGAAVVRGGDGAEALLAGGVPNLELDGLAVELDGADLKVDADGGDVGFRVGVVGESEEKARLADAGVSDEQELEEVIAVGRRGG